MKYKDKKRKSKMDKKAYWAMKKANKPAKKGKKGSK